MSAAGDPTEEDVRHKATQESECVGYHLIIVDSMFATIRLQYHSSLYYAIFGSEIHNVERVPTNNTITCISLNMILITIELQWRRSFRFDILQNLREFDKYFIISDIVFIMAINEPDRNKFIKLIQLI